MKPIVIVVLIVMAAASAQQQSSWEALENLDVDNVLKNTKLVKRYLDCLLDRGRCEKNGRDWKGNLKQSFNSKLQFKNPICNLEMLPRILNEGCRACTPKQVDKSNQVINFMKANHLEDWNAIDAKYRTG